MTRILQSNLLQSPPLSAESIDGQSAHQSTQALTGGSSSSNQLLLPNGKTLGEPVIVIKNLSKSFKLQVTDDGDGDDDTESNTGDDKNGKEGSTLNDKRVTALDDINLCGNDLNEHYAIRRGEFVILRGASGGGKSTLLNCIGALDLPTSGKIVIDGLHLSNKTPDAVLSKMRLSKIGFIFQTFNLLGTLSAYENVELPMTILGKLNKKQRKERTIALLTRVGLLDRMSHLPSEMSGGECQRVAIARALANEPEIVLADEPTGDLDSKNTIEIMNLLHQINNPYLTGNTDGLHESNLSTSANASTPKASQQFGTTIIMVTHNPDVEVYADRILYIQDGRIVRQVLNDFKIDIGGIDPEQFQQWVRNLDKIGNDME
ncbi:hypothetical protein MP228_000958 [Amoeboaphelidium protococcarum]|nr:hypothetical protein MP228_000958 [Amoeboaphelidium protococcarum]